ncbi:glycosyltransferase [Pantoea sp. CCBC3-3-1]|uniref:glycosyltransferase n=1 Tax=Pantoea sp. CCBC3-3-1 TaxID=2490851 RepID=UPI0011BF1204|nr:glycosyltransferase [Pantoea sp. CCBC3-3-1]
MKTLFELYENHHGKSSDKWTIYLETYHEFLSPLQEKPVNFLEIGVQNGGSLEIWSKYFPNANNIIGCDINEKCASLEYDNTKISLVIGNSSTAKVRNCIAEISPRFDVIVDDGSHDSSDIIKSFLLYFPLIEEDGFYIIEDLHCSYWLNFEGGLYDPYSSMAFLKKLGDIPNHEHWGSNKQEKDYLRPFYEHYDCIDFDTVDYSEIHSVTFVNSLCIIQKRKKESNILGPRVIAGEVETVVQGHSNIHGSFNEPQDQFNNPWRNLPTFPEMEWKEVKENLSSAEKKLSKNLDEIRRLKADITHYKENEEKLRQQVAEKDELIHRLSHDNHALLTSTSWKVTQPLRKSATHLRKVKKGVDLSGQIVRDYGLSESINRAKNIYNQHGFRGLINKLRYINQLQQLSAVVESKALAPVTLRAEALLIPKVLIIAEVSIPQCKKYRVDQKVELFNRLGIEVTVLPWSHQNECIKAMQSHTLVIFYRVPGFASLDPVFAECKRLNITTLWEVDDLIFDAEILRNSKTLQALDTATYNGLLDGAHLYKSAMLQCSGAIASTQHLADEMVKAGAKYAYVVENALDPETITAAESITTGRKSLEDGIIRIVYGSGTTTHNIDFLEAADAIVSVLRQNKNVHFRLIGNLDLPASFKEVEAQVEYIDLCPYRDYLKVLAECDISLAPLEDYIFNYSKSNIKYIEASILSIPSVCSPRPTFSRVIKHGENGFLCETPQEWEDVLMQLIESETLRTKVGAQAYHSVYEHYLPENIAHEQVKNIISDYARLNENDKKNILSVNCYYNPRSFGGATVVAEEINKRFASNEDINIHVLTSLSEEYVPAYELRRYQSWDHECFGIGLPRILQPNEHIVNRKIEPAFSQVLDIVKPDAVHFHSIQGLGVTMLEMCAERQIPVIVTTHDYWWLYEHQFILSYQDKHPADERDKNKIYYNQKKRDALSLASVLLAPGAFCRDLYKSEGFKEISVNKNGVNYPAVNIERTRPTTLRFGYLGGNTEIKGFHLLKAAFKNISAQDAALTIIDNTLALGFSSFSESDLANFKNYQLAPAFSQETMDDFYNSIDVLIYPTQSKESFGLTVREALVRNVWVITSDAGGAAEDIIEGRNGTIIPFNNNAEELEKAIVATIAHFRQLPAGKMEDLPHSHIRSFDEQYEELVEIYRSAH